MAYARSTPVKFDKPLLSGRSREAVTMPYELGGRRGRARAAVDGGIDAKLHPKPQPAGGSERARRSRRKRPSDGRDRDLLESAADWLWESNADLDVISITPTRSGAMPITGSLAVGCNLFDLPGLGREARDHMRRAIDDGRSFRVEAESPSGDGRGKAYCRLAGFPYFDDDSGRFAGYRGTGAAMETSSLSDERDRDRAASPRAACRPARRDEAQPAQDNGQRNLGDLRERFANASHELRTPLNAILGFAELIMSRGPAGDPARYGEYGKCIYDSGVHLLELIESLVEGSDAEAGGGSLELQALDIGELVAGVLRIAKDESTKASVALVNEVPDRLPMVRGDRRAVRQILLNLVSNAIKYTPGQGSAGVEAKGLLKLTIWDTGIGIATQDQEKVFNRSYRAPDVRDEIAGSGVGLSIARNLARAMDGEITIDSEPGKGSRISLWLPLECGEPATAKDH